eukprot:scaffold11763_cov69-Cylindrotheca_fusiformis.AAC.1
MSLIRGVPYQGARVTTFPQNRPPPSFTLAYLCCYAVSMERPNMEERNLEAESFGGKIVQH